MNTGLGRLVNVALAGTAAGLVLLAAGTTIIVFSSTTRQFLNVGQVSRVAYRVGEKADVPSALFARNHVTAIVFSRSTCPGCITAKPLLRRVADLLTQLGDARMVIITAGDQSEGELEYARDIGVSWDGMYTLDPEDVRVQVTPTLLIVDNRGRIIFAREGAIQAEDAVSVDRALRTEIGLQR